MKNSVFAIFAGLLLILISANASAQLQIIVTIDTSFAHGGKVETSLGGFGDEVTDFYGIFPDLQSNSKITVCGKVGTADPALYKLGMIQLNPNGSFDSSFGVNGKVISSWSISDYPNAMYVNPFDSSIVLAGMSATSSNSKDHLLALFKFKKNGVPDASFGGDGHLAVRFDSSSSGEFTNVYGGNGMYLACGKNRDTITGTDGFCAMRFFANGKIDSSFGISGRAIVFVNAAHSLSSVTAFRTRNDTIAFIGALTDNRDSSTSEIILARMTEKGIPDLSFGKNAVQKTGITYSILGGGISIVAATQPNYQIVAAIPPSGISDHEFFTIVRFTKDGTVDTSYGTNGFVHVLFSPGTAEAKGINIAKNAKAVVNGAADDGCATTRLNPDGSPDITFNQIGRAKIDVDSGAYQNYLKNFVGIGFKKYVGVGGSIHNGLNQFLVAKFKDDTLHSSVRMSDDASNIRLYPNPAHNNFTIASANDPIKNIKVVDALGREMKIGYTSQDSKVFSFDVSLLTNGMYYCIMQIGNEEVITKFVIEH